tara:strand:+ start:4643 stop:5236 length:594 start_codon:yes stop_codon:yes gene_type:complete
MRNKVALSKQKTDTIDMVKTKTKRGRKASTTIKAIAGRPLTDEEIKQFVTHYESNGNFPGHKIPCVVTGKLTTCVGPWMKKKIKEFGSVEALLRGYQCRGAIKSARPQKIKKIGKRAEKKAKKESTKRDIPVMPTGTQRPETDEEFREASKIACARPDIYLDNGRNCEGCPNYEICDAEIKKLPKGVAFKDGKFVSK